MVQLNLPKNSKVTEGKTWAYPTGAKEVLKKSVARYVAAINGDSRKG